MSYWAEAHRLAGIRRAGILLFLALLAGETLTTLANSLVNDFGRSQDQRRAAGYSSVLVNDDFVAADSVVLACIAVAGRVADGQIRSLEQFFELSAFFVQKFFDLVFSSVS